MVLAALVQRDFEVNFENEQLVYFANYNAKTGEINIHETRVIDFDKVEEFLREKEYENLKELYSNLNVLRNADFCVQTDLGVYPGYYGVYFSTKEEAIQAAQEKFVRDYLEKRKESIQEMLDQLDYIKQIDKEMEEFREKFPDEKV